MTIKETPVVVAKMSCLHGHHHDFNMIVPKTSVVFNFIGILCRATMRAALRLSPASSNNLAKMLLRAVKAPHPCSSGVELWSYRSLKQQHAFLHCRANIRRRCSD